MPPTSASLLLGERLRRSNQLGFATLRRGFRIARRQRHLQTRGHWTPHVNRPAGLGTRGGSSVTLLGGGAASDTRRYQLVRARVKNSGVDLHENDDIVMRRLHSGRLSRAENIAARFETGARAVAFGGRGPSLGGPCGASGSADVGWKRSSLAPQLRSIRLVELERSLPMTSKPIAALAFAAFAGQIVVIWAPQASGAPANATACTSYSPVLDPAHFVAVIDNPYFPLPVGRTLVYTGVKDGQSQTDTVIVTDQKKVILGIPATVVSDIATHNGTVLERTFDYYAQDDEGNVWYLGEDTTAFLPHGKTDTSG